MDKKQGKRKGFSHYLHKNYLYRLKIQVNSVYVRKFVIKSSQIKCIINLQKVTLCIKLLRKEAFMKDLDKDFGLDDNSVPETRENKYSNEEVIGYAQANEDSTEGLQKNEEAFEKDYETLGTDCESLETQKETAYKEGEDPQKEDKATQEEGEDHTQKGKDHQEKIQGDKEEIKPGVDKQFSSCYSPPYYVPNFTVNNGEEHLNANGKIKRSSTGASWKMLIILSAVLVCVFIAFLLGAFSGVILPFGSGNPDSSSGYNGEVIEIVQNSPSINITEKNDGAPLTLPEVVQAVGNSVVEISTSSVVTDIFYGQYVTSGAGSGVIITQSDVAGYLLTNHHVVDGAEEVIVRLTNREEYVAEVINSTATLDLALLRIVKKGNEEFTVATIGNSSKLVVGQEVIAIGNPLGSLGGTVTDGIISALDRNVSIDGISMTLLQHNAAINPGNSGGALFDMAGNLVGIVNAKTSESGIEGLGFAIPVNIAFDYFKGVMNSSSIGATVDYGYNSKRIYGVYVLSVTAASQFKVNDRIVKIEDTEIKTLNDYYSTVDLYKKGDTVRVTVVRKNMEVELEIIML